MSIQKKLQCVQKKIQKVYEMQLNQSQQIKSINQALSPLNENIHNKNNQPIINHNNNIHPHIDIDNHNLQLVEDEHGFVPFVNSLKCRLVINLT